MFSLPSHLLLEIARTTGTPAYVYDVNHIRQRVDILRKALGGYFQIGYAMKANPNPLLLQRMREIVDLLDVSSGGEVSRAIDAGWNPSHIGFTGPAKRDAELELSVQRQIGHVIIESVAEAHRLNTMAEASGWIQPILIRISPLRIPAGFGARMAGKPTQFGVDEEVIDDAIRAIAALGHLRLDGFHVYSGTQCLNPDAIVEHFELTFALFEGVCVRHNLSPRTLIIGSGFGIPYHDGDTSLDLETLGPRIRERAQHLKSNSRFTNTTLVLETGRFLIGEAGCYLTRVVSTKRSRGVRICVCDGGMNHHLAAAGHLGSVIHRSYPMFKVSDAPTAGAPAAETELYPQQIYGPLCTSIDLLANQIKLPLLEPGDVVAICCSGAYGLSASPINFISHPLAAEVLVEKAGDRFVTTVCRSLGGETNSG